MKKRETVKEDTKMNSIPVDEEEKRKREDRKNRFSTPHKVPPIPKRTYAWEGGQITHNKDVALRKYLSRLKSQGKTLSPQQQAILEKINTPEKTSISKREEDGSDSSSSSEEDDWDSLCKETRESDVRNGILISSPIVKGDESSSSDDGWISPKGRATEKKEQGNEKKKKKKSTKNKTERTKNKKSVRKKKGKREKQETSRKNKDEKQETSRKNKDEKKESSLLTKSVFESLRQLCAKDDRYSIDHFDDRALKKLSVASETVALSSIDKLRKHPATAINNASALLTRTLARLKRDLVVEKKEKKKSRPQRVENTTTKSNSTSSNEFLTPKKKSPENKEDYGDYHTVSVSRRRGGRRRNAVGKSKEKKKPSPKKD